jgi:DNA-binding transcriptional LysR family regulator
LETRFLESFLTVVEAGSIAEAARRLRVTPAAIAQRIKALEDDIGRSLLIRSGRTVRATPAGIGLLDRAKRLVREINELRSVAATDQPVGELRLGATPSVFTGLLPSAVKRLTTKYPHIGLRLMPGTSAELYAEVEAGNLDAAVMVRQFKSSKSLEWKEIRREPLIVIAPLSFEGTDAHTALTRFPLVRYDRMMWGGKMAEAYLRSSRIHVREFMEIQSLEAIFVFVSQGLGVSLVPDWRPTWERGLPLRKLPIDDKAPARSIGILWTRNSPAIKLIDALIEEFV